MRGGDFVYEPLLGDRLRRSTTAAERPVAAEAPRPEVRVAGPPQSAIDSRVPRRFHDHAA